MKERKVTQVIRGTDAIDGAGVHLSRVLSRPHVKDFDPFLMLDSFDSENPEDYIKGFPMHPHRGIETVTYLIQGSIIHEDSLGNKGVIESGCSQWMTAGSGIMHQEMPQPAKKMLGFQLWLNLPQVEKMTEPKYFEIRKEDIPIVQGDGFSVSIVSGEFQGTKGVKSHHIQAMILDATVEAKCEIRIPTPKGETVFVFLLEGEGQVAEEIYHEKSAILFDDGDFVKVRATEKALHFVLFSAPPIKESIAWGGPIVMNTEEELRQAFADLEDGAFIKESPKLSKMK
ncbi:pirin family protein [Acetobacterium paludosum]|uniref:Pirin family protein n=1 Tax=Acetobacterium paludosum TaxID=52693 RepID=A0A923KVL4_9FIRM|nr:pirin family protein [Acetobacterium paludosum]MBC3887585.1 pirin family protein [Acetobacterium paludosum]